MSYYADRSKKLLLNSKRCCDIFRLLNHYPLLSSIQYTIIYKCNSCLLSTIVISDVEQYTMSQTVNQNNISLLQFISSFFSLTRLLLLASCGGPSTVVGTIFMLDSSTGNASNNEILWQISSLSSSNIPLSLKHTHQVPFNMILSY